MRDFASNQRRFNLAQELMLEKGLIRSKREMPILFKAAWALGFPTPLGLFGSFRSNALFCGVYFGIAWGVLMWLTSWQETDTPIGVGIVASILAGLLFGLFMATYYRWRARKLGLPEWSELRAETEVFD